MRKEENGHQKSNPRELTCFIIMPFSEITFRTSTNENKTLSEELLADIYEQLFKRAVESYNRNDVHFIANRYTSQRGNFVKGIISDLDTTDLVIADLTGLNHNVFYELGVRHTLKCGTLMLTQNKKELASDLSNYIAIEYKYPEQSHEFNRYYPNFEKELHIAIAEVLANPDRSDNPVRDFIGDRNIFRNEQRIKEIKVNIELMKLVRDEYLINVVELGRLISAWGQGKPKKAYSPDNSAEPFLNRLMMLNEKVGVISFVHELVHSIKIIEQNMKHVSSILVDKRSVGGKMGLGAVWEVPWSFADASPKRHHILELQDYYIDGNGNLKQIKEFCPVFMSFEKFIKDWEDELEKLSK